MVALITIHISFNHLARWFNINIQLSSTRICHCNAPIAMYVLNFKCIACTMAHWNSACKEKDDFKAGLPTQLKLFSLHTSIFSRSGKTLRIKEDTMETFFPPWNYYYLFFLIETFYLISYLGTFLSRSPVLR